MDFKWDPEVEKTEIRGGKFADQVLPDWARDLLT